MSSTVPVPTVADFLAAGASAVRVDGDQTMNVRRGSVVDLTSGPAALAWAQQAARDRDLFRGVYTDSAAGSRLEEIVTLKYGVPRIQATRGQGKAILVRADDVGGGGKLYAGTRIAVRRGTSSIPLYYSIAADYTVPAAAGILAIQVDIQATRPGSGVKIDKPLAPVIEDVVYDPSWTVQTLWCADGTDEEPPEVYVSRARTKKRDERPGYRKRIEDVCKAAGAAQIVILEADELGPAADFGVTHVYVADAGFSSTEALVNACSDAVDAAHIEGCDMQVLGMTPTPVTVALTVSLWNPGKTPTTPLALAIRSALLAMFNRRPRFWLFDHDSMAGEVGAASLKGDIQSVVVVTDPTPPAAAFVASLPRYTLAATDIGITFTGPA